MVDLSSVVQLVMAYIKKNAETTQHFYVVAYKAYATKG